MTQSLPRAFALALILLLSTTGCILVAGAGAGYLIHREVTDDAVYSAEVKQDVDHVWMTVRESLEILHDLNTDLSFTNSPRTGKATVDGAEVVVDVMAIDLDRTRIRIQADKLLYDDEPIAEKVQQHILRRL